MGTVNKWVLEGETLVSPENHLLQYSGRIDFDKNTAPVFVFPCSYVSMKFIGTSIKMIVENHRHCWDNYLGYIIDGKQEKVLLEQDGISCITLAEGLEEVEHTLLLFKRMDSCHMFTFYGFVLNKSAKVLETLALPTRKIEVYGDSVSAGEVSEATDFTGKPDPIHNGEYSNSWYSYAWMTARKLQAQIHNIAQGGIALLDNTGWFSAPNYIGLEQTFDKIEYNKDLGESKPWDFSQYTPQVVIIAIGQNDNHPIDYMKEDYHSLASENWRKHYKAFVEGIRKRYHHALIILTTTILCHDPNWDMAIDEVCKDINDEKIVNFLYSLNGCGTPGHIRISEAELMSDELASFIQAFGNNIWEK